MFLRQRNCHFCYTLPQMLRASQTSFDTAWIDIPDNLQYCFDYRLQHLTTICVQLTNMVHPYFSTWKITIHRVIFRTSFLYVCHVIIYNITRCPYHDQCSIISNYTCDILSSLQYEASCREGVREMIVWYALSQLFYNISRNRRFSLPSWRTRWRAAGLLSGQGHFVWLIFV